MIRRYTNFFKFLKDMPQLKNNIIIFPNDIEGQMMMLKSHQYKAFKDNVKRLNIKIIIEKDRYYEDKGIIKKAQKEPIRATK